MNHLAHVLGSGNNKINVSQSVVLIEFNRKTTGMKVTHRYTECRSPSGKERRNSIMKFKVTGRKGTSAYFWPALVLGPQWHYLHNQVRRSQTPQTWWPSRSAHDGPWHSHVTQLHWPPPNTATEWHLLQLSLLKGRAAPGYPRFERTQLSCIVLLCQVTYSVLRYCKMRFLSQKKYLRQFVSSTSIALSAK